MFRYPSKCQYIHNTYPQQKLTAFDGELVGISVGLRGALEGDWLGLEVGCKIDDAYCEIRRVSV